MEIIDKTIDFVKKELEGDSSGHDWWHVYRVWKIAKTIGENESSNLLVVELAALLHDVDDWKITGDVEPVKAKRWLEDNNVDENIINQVCDIIRTLSFKGANTESKMLTKEGEAVQDADRLDAIGAIGIGRTFAYGGANGREMYNPNIKPEIHSSFEEYKKSKSPTLNHFHEKLLLLKNRMNTEEGKKIAEKRHKYMEEYIDRFLREWEGII